MGPPGKQYTCQICKNVYTQLSNLYRHAKTKHKSREELLPIKCKETGCNFECRVIQRFIDHLTSLHNMDLEYSFYEFNSTKEYKEWKDRVEKHTRSFYIQVSGAKKYKDFQRTYLYCNRSGSFKTKSKGHRQLKETIKIGQHCTSHIILTEYCGDNRRIEIKFCKTHYGHTCGIQHFQLKKLEKRLIKGQINQGDSINSILDNVRMNLSGDYQTQKDLTNTLLKNFVPDIFNTPSDSAQFCHHENALASWVEGVKTLGEYNPVKFYKPRGVEDQKLKLDIDDFCLLILTKAQEEILKKFKTNLICIDKITEVKRTSELGLSSLIVTDEKAMAVPVSFLISSKQDQKMFSVFFEVLKNIVGDIDGKYIMTEDDGTALLAWKAIIANDPKHLVSPWRVDRTWRENLGQLSTPFAKAAVYKTIKAMHVEICVERFNVLLAECLGTFFKDPSVEDFGKYFEHFYCGDPSSWAYCYNRIDAGNLFVNLEALRNALQNIFNVGIKMKQVDNSIVALLKMFRDNNFDFMLDIMTNDGFLTEESILERHEVGESLDSLIIQVSDSMWTITTEFSDKESYIIHKAVEDCSCSIRCSICCICVHAYYCSCPSALIKYGLCSHVHFLVTKLKNNLCVPIATTPPNVEHEPETVTQLHHQDRENTSSRTEAFSNMQAQLDTLESLEKRRSEALHEIGKLMKAVQNSNSMDRINTALKEVKSILNLATEDEINENYGPPSPAEPIITLEEETFTTNKKEEHFQNEYVNMTDVTTVEIENDEGPLCGARVIPTENILEVAIQDSLEEENSEIMIIDSGCIDLTEFKSDQNEVKPSEQNQYANMNKEDSQESVMLWLQSD